MTDDEKPIVRPARIRLNFILNALAIVLGTAFSWMASTRYAPGSLAAPPFTSDSAIAVIMSRGPYPSLFSAYYYGQDRFGSLPFLLHALLARLIGFQVNPLTLYAQLCIVIFLSLIIFLQRAVNSWPAALAAFAIVAVTISLDRRFVDQIFELSKVYPWQLALLLVALPSVESGTRLVMASVFICLATWMNPLSSVFMAVALGCCFLVRRGYKGGVPSLIFVVLPAALEAGLRNVYHLVSNHDFGIDYSFPLEGVMLHPFWDHVHRAWVEVNDAVTLGGLGVSVVAISVGLARPQGDRSRPWLLGFCLTGMAVANFFACTLSKYVARNGAFESRYFSLSRLCVLLAAVLFLVWAARSLARRTIPMLAVAATCFGLGLLLLPPDGADTKYSKLQETAMTLVGHPQPVVVMGSYWETYVYVALVPEGSLAALPFKSEYDRMPWVARDLFPLAKTVAVVGAPPSEDFDDRGRRFHRSELRGNVGLYAQ